MERADSSTQPGPQEAGSSTGAGELLARWAAVVVSRPGRIATLVALLAVLAALAAALGLRVRPGYVDLLAPGSPINQRYAALLEELGNVEALYLVVESEDEAAAAAFVDRLVPALLELEDEAGEPLVRDALGRVELAWFRDRLPLHLPDELLREGGPLDDEAFRTLVKDPSAFRLLRRITAELQRAIDEGRELEGAGELLGTVEALVYEIGAAAGGDPQASLGRLLMQRIGVDARGKLDAEGRVRLGDGRFLVTVTPTDERNDFNWLAAFLDEVQAAEARTLDELGSPPVRVLHAGAPVLVVDEMEASRRDVTRSSLLALLLVAALFFASFHSLRHVGSAVVALLAGLGLTFGAALLLVGYLNLFSVVFAAVLIGLGIDFGIHVVNGYEGARRAGLDAKDAVTRSMRIVGPATALGAITTAAAFFTTTSSEFRGFSQLGLITGAGVLLCLVTAFTLLPALLVLLSRGGDRSPRRPWSLRLLGLPVRHPVAAALGAGLLVAAAGWSVPGLSFDYDLLNLQPAGTEAVELSRGSADERVQTHQAFSLAPDLSAAARRAEAFRGFDSVASVSCAADLLPAELGERAPALRRLASGLRLAGIDGAGRGGPSIDQHRQALSDLEDALLDAQELAFEAGRSELVAALGRAAGAASATTAALDRNSLPGLADFRDRNREVLAAMAEATLAYLESPERPELPPALAARLVGASGSYAVIVEPREAVWNRPALERFVTDLRSVDPEVTGPPVQILEITEMMRRSYERAAVLAFAVIAVIVLLALRSLFGVVLTLAPLLCGFVLTLGALRWLGIPLNPANLVALPLVLGIGVDNGIHVAHRWLRLRDARTAVFEVGHAIVVTSLTTMAGFAGLLIAAHRGVRSLGAVAVVGTCAMLLCSVVLLPAVLKLLERRLPGAPPSAES